MPCQAGENNLRLADVKAGDTPQRTLIKSTKEEQGAKELPTIDLNVNSFPAIEEHVEQPSAPPNGCMDNKNAPTGELDGLPKPHAETPQLNGKMSTQPPRPHGEMSKPDNEPKVETVVDEDKPLKDIENNMTQ